MLTEPELHSGKIQAGLIARENVCSTQDVNTITLIGHTKNTIL